MGKSIKTFHSSPALSGDDFELRQLIGSKSRDDIAAFFGVSTTTLQRWLDGRTRVPVAVMRLARLRWLGDLSAVFGPAWCELSIGAGGLMLPGCRVPYSPGDLRSMAARLAQVQCLTHQIEQTRKDLKRAENALEASEAAREYYRSQLKAESRHASILLALAA